MIPFEYEGKQYKLLFRYGLDKRGRRTTTAFVCEQGKNMPVLFEGMSTCSLDDNFDKEAGRQIAIRRLCSLQVWPDLRYERIRLFWAALNTAYWTSAKRITCEHMQKEKNLPKRWAKGHSRKTLIGKVMEAK